MSTMIDFFRAVPKKRKVKIKKGGGIVYHNPPVFRKVVFYLGTCIFVSGWMYLGYLYSPLISAIYQYKHAQKQEIVTPKVEIDNSDKSFYIQIPKILAFSKVEEGVSPFDKAEYERVLKQNLVAQAKGSATPGGGEGKTTYIFAHSSQEGVEMVRNNAVFYLLGELQIDDQIFLKYQGKDYEYRVREKRIVGAKEVSYLNYSDPNREMLILQTCWPIGTDWNRLLVMAELINS
jgi:LPXTG-site transpeptidase (sortase) family protein